MNVKRSSRPSSTAGKLGLLGSLYFSQGLPFGFFAQALPVILRKQGFSLGDIGLSSLLALPWALKFLWAPVVDRFAVSRFGRRRSWILPLQALSILTLGWLALESSTPTMGILMSAFFLLNLLSATQDIAADGLAVDLLSTRERGIANGLQVAGYRIGMIAGGGALLIFHERLGWQTTFTAMAALLALAAIPIIATREPVKTDGETAPRHPAVAHFLFRPGSLRLLTLIVVYKIGDAFATGMLRPFLADTGLSLGDVGWLLGTVGFVSGLAGALCGGALVNLVGRRNSLVVFGLAQAATVGGYAYLSAGTPTRLMLNLLCGAEHFAGGMATAALFTCMMDWCSRETSATDYTVQASAVVIATGAASALSGFSADLLGYFGHFALATAIAFSSIIAVFFLFPQDIVIAETDPKGKEACSCA